MMSTNLTSRFGQTPVSDKISFVITTTKLTLHRYISLLYYVPGPVRTAIIVLTSSISPPTFLSSHELEISPAYVKKKKKIDETLMCIAKDDINQAARAHH